MWNVGNDERDREWHDVPTPFSVTLYDVVQTSEGPYAIGAGGTLVADRTDGTDDNEAMLERRTDWDVVLDDGPHVKDNRLSAMDVTNDGKRIWFAGSSGALGCYDVEERMKYDYSHPKQKTSTWEGIAVAGPAGEEKALVANGSGEILPFMMDGWDVDWGVVHKPQQRGATIAALDATPSGIGFAIDSSGNAFKTSDEEGWIDIGIVNAQVRLNDVWAGENQQVYVAAGDGRLYRYDDSYHEWTPLGVASEPLRAVDVYQDTIMVMGDSGTCYERVGEERWEEVHTPTEANLYDLVLGTPDVAVGASSTVLVRPRKHAWTSDERLSPDDDQYDARGENFDHDANEPGETTSDGSTSGSDSTSG